MANKYKVYDNVEEEDRETLNDFYRSQTKYYETQNEINQIILKELKNMSSTEIKDVIKNSVVTRLK